MDITDEMLREYCNYLIDNYGCLNPEKWQNSGFYLDLNQFRNELLIK